MRQKSGPEKAPAEQVVKDIRRATRRQFSAEEKIRIVLEGVRGDIGARPQSVGEMLESMRMLSSEGMTVIVVTHEIAFALPVLMRSGLGPTQPSPDRAGARRRGA